MTASARTNDRREATWNLVLHYSTDALMLAQGVRLVPRYLKFFGSAEFGVGGLALHAPVAALIGVAQAAGGADFFAWSWPPAKIFIGDAGSTAPGFAIAGLPMLLVVETRGAWSLSACWPRAHSSCGRFWRTAASGFCGGSGTGKIFFRRTVRTSLNAW